MVPVNHREYLVNTDNRAGAGQEVSDISYSRTLEYNLKYSEHNKLLNFKHLFFLKDWDMLLRGCQYYFITLPETLKKITIQAYRIQYQPKGNKVKVQFTKLKIV